MDDKTKNLKARLDAMAPAGEYVDCERVHDLADEILLEAVPPEIAEAYRALVERAPWWACA